jgi:hypothetical protein
MKPATAIRILMGLIAVIILFHIAVLVKIIPYDIAWGGRLQNDSEMYVFETISIAINVLLAMLLLIKCEMIKVRFNKKAINIILWVFVVLFVLNTIGNLFAKTNFEKSFALVTAAFAFLIWSVLRSGR